MYFGDGEAMLAFQYGLAGFVECRVYEGRRELSLLPSENAEEVVDDLYGLQQRARVVEVGLGEDDVDECVQEALVGKDAPTRL